MSGAKPGNSVKGLCGPVREMYCAATQEKSQMQDLNNVLAAYIDRVRDMRHRAGAHLDPQSYKDAMKVLEDEILNLKNMYENELGRLRNLVDEGNKERSDLLANVGSYNNMASGLKNRLDVEVTGNQKALQDISNLQRSLAEKEKEIAHLRGCLRNYESELNLRKLHLQQALQDCDALRKRLEKEESLRHAAEEKLKHLFDKLEFDTNAVGQENRDLKERVKSLNDIIASLESKIQQLSQADGNNTVCHLNKLRDGTNAELRKYRDEAERVLNNAISVMRSQREEDSRSKNALMSDKARLENLVTQLQGRVADLEGQLSTCEQQRHALGSTLNTERESCNMRVRGLEKRLDDMNDEIFAKTKDMTNAREAQVSLQAEINTYRSLLDEGKDAGLPDIKWTNGSIVAQPANAWYTPRETVVEKKYESYKAPSKYELNIVRNCRQGVLGNYHPTTNFAATSMTGNVYTKSRPNYMTYQPPNNVNLNPMDRSSYSSFR